MAEINEKHPTFARDPYSVYAGLRTDQPVSRVSYFGLDAWMVTGYELVRQALLDPGLSTNQAHANAAAMHVPWAAAGKAMGLNDNMLFADGSDHARLRSAVGKAFTARRIEALRPAVERLAEELIDRFAGQGHTDLMEGLAFPLPSAVIMELLGVSLDFRDEFNTWIRRANLPKPDEFALVPQAWGRVNQIVDDIIREKEKEPGDDLFSALIAAQADTGDGLTHDELRSTGVLLLMAGYLTTTDLIGNGMHTLLTRPEQLAALAADPSRIPGAIEEMLRHDGPVANAMIRYATQDVTIGDTTIARGDAVVLVLGAADRDPAQFPEPDRFDPSRRTTGALSFGHGMHYCLGAPLARLEANVAFTALLRRLPNLALDCDPTELAWRPGPMTHGLLRLPVRFTPQ